MTMLLQAATPPASFLAYWPQILTTLGVFGAIIAFVTVAVFDAQFIGAFDRCKDRIMSRIDEWYKVRIAMNADTSRKVDINSDRLAAFEASLMQQGLALKTQLESHFAQNTVALQAVTTALQAVQREAQATAEDVAHIRGFMEAAGEWDGTNRRKRTRRNPNGSP